MRKTFQLVESLESRQLFSGSAGGHLHTHVSSTTTGTVTDATINADAQLVVADRTQLNADRKTYNALLVADAKAYRAAVKALASQLQPLQDHYNDDASGFVKASKSHSSAQATIVAQYNPIFLADRQAIKNAADDQAKAAAEAQLATDKAAFETALQSAKSNADALRSALKNDRKAISSLLTTDPSVKTALDQYLADATTRSTVLQADNAKLQTDLAKLKADKAAKARGGTDDTSTDTGDDSTSA